MNKKYVLTENTRDFFGITLYQIKATRAFYNVEEGMLGGWVEGEHNLSQFGRAWLYDNSCAYGRARVSGDARLFENSRVSGNALVSGDACVYGNACITDDALVFGDTRVYGNAFVSGYALLDKGMFGSHSEFSSNLVK